MAITNAMRYRKYGRNWGTVEHNSINTTLFGVPVKMHKLVVPYFKKWEHNVRAYEDAHDLKHWKPKVIQCGNWRMIAGTNKRSLHSWRIAVDIDPALNAMGGRHDHLPNYVVAPTILGKIKWGGRWRNRDLMHFEYQS